MRQDTDVNTSSLQTRSKETFCLMKMVRENSKESPEAHRCGLSCLGPITFHSEAVGAEVRLSEGGRLAQRKGNTFKNGLVFSSRPVKINEKVRLRVEDNLSNWHGALRVGFTNVPPSARPLPLPIMAIPNLTDTPGNWAGPVHESLCQTGAELEFWVSYGGNIYVKVNNRKHKVFTGVDLTLPLWAMMDVYGQTRSIYLMGSEKSGPFCTRRSCPAPERLSPSAPAPGVDNHYTYIPDDDCISCLDIGAGDSTLRCVVCLGKEARVILRCGHRCLCSHCAPRVFEQFDCCPLCRGKI